VRIDFLIGFFSVKKYTNQLGCLQFQCREMTRFTMLQNKIMAEEYKELCPEKD
jgi:hypothetical protein